MKNNYGQRNFWRLEYYVDTVGKNTEKIAEYIRTQIQEDQVYDQISMKEYEDPGGFSPPAFLQNPMKPEIVAY